MVPKPGLSVAATVLLVAGFAGCLEEDKGRATDYHAAASADGFLFFGWAYDGTGSVPFAGKMSIHANDKDNTGEVLVHGMVNGKDWTILMMEKDFAQQGDKAFQDGGIAANLFEHGDSGNGDSSIPKVKAEMAAWGEANFTQDEVGIPDPITGDAKWIAHYMVLSTGIRDGSTRAITTGDKKTPYDPTNGADGYAEDGDFEIHFQLRPHQAPPQNDTPVDIRPSGAVNGAAPASPYGQNHAFPSNKYLGTKVNLTLNLSAAPNLAATQLTFAFKDPAGRAIKVKDGTTGQEVDAVTLGGGTGSQASRPVSFGMNQTGEYVVRVSGSAVNAQYSVRGAMTPPPNVLVNFYWEDVVFGAEAEKVEEELAGAHTH